MNNFINITSLFAILNQTSPEDMALETKNELDKAGNSDGESEAIMCKKSESPFYRQPLIYDHPRIIYFFQTPYLWQHYFDNVVQMIYGVNTKINSWKKVISSCLENYKTMSHSFLYKQHFYMPHQAKIWFELIK